jgi:hypothetical protein
VSGAGIKAIALAALLLAPAPALAATWEHYAYDYDGFAVQSPAPFVSAKALFKTPSGLIAPETTYTARQDDVVLQMTVIDFRGTSVDKQTGIDMAVAGLGRDGEIKLNINERIDSQFGRNLTIAGRDGSRSTAAVYFVNGKLYELVGKALPPDPNAGSAKAVRFQQSLEFIGLGAEAHRPENQPDGQGPGAGLGGGGAGFGRGGLRRPPPQAFADCEGKNEGERVQHATPFGVVAAACVQTPQGLAARPLSPPPGGSDGPPPDDPNARP